MSATNPRAISGAANSISSTRNTCAAITNATLEPVLRKLADEHSAQ